MSRHRSQCTLFMHPLPNINTLVRVYHDNNDNIRFRGPWILQPTLTQNLLNLVIFTDCHPENILVCFVFLKGQSFGIPFIFVRGVDILLLK